MAQIELEHLTKVFAGGTVAVDDVNLRVEDGEFMVLVGPSGCGKSTLLRMIAGLEEVSDGHIRVGGRDVTDLAPRRRDVAMVFQSYALYPHMSVRQNIGYGLKVRKTPKAETKRRVEEVAGLLGLDELLDRRPAISERICTRSSASRFDSGSSIRKAEGSRTIARPIATR